MPHERPSQRKVVGVSVRYLKYLERMNEMTAAMQRFDSEELSVEEVTAIMSLIMANSVVHLIATPLQRMRHNFLNDEREREGKRSGEELIATYALGKLSFADQKKFPLVVNSIWNGPPVEEVDTV